MDQKIENDDKKKSKKRRILLLVILLLFLFIPVLFFLGRDSRLGMMIFGQREVAQKEDISKTDDGDNAEADDTGDNSVDQEIADETQMVSENYRVSQIKFGGNVMIDNGQTRDLDLEIYQVKSENTISQEDDTPRILITWKTNKEAVSVVSYAKIDGKGGVDVTEEGYGFEHSMLLKNMEFSTIYTYKIEAKDKWGNKVATEYFSAYTGDKSESIFDLITNAVEDVFGWAMK